MGDDPRKVPGPQVRQLCRLDAACAATHLEPGLGLREWFPCSTQEWRTTAQPFLLAPAMQSALWTAYAGAQRGSLTLATVKSATTM